MDYRIIIDSCGLNHTQNADNNVDIDNEED